MVTDSDSAGGRRRRSAGLVLGPTLALVMLAAGPPGALGTEAWAVATVTVLMALWWVTEAVPIPVTALLPIVLLPVLGVSSVEDAAAPYANPLIFLFLGGFLIALAIQRWSLHRRIALLVVAVAGQRPDRLVAGFMVATAVLSMWVSNTATAAMMLPIGLSVIALMEGHYAGSGTAAQRRFAVALLLGIAFGANIGGMGTLIGTPPNALLAAFVSDTYGTRIGFAEWMLVGVPTAVVMLIVAWWLVTRWAFPVERQALAGVGHLINRQRVELGRLSGPERRVLVVFTCTGAAWVLRPLLEQALPGVILSDAGIAIAGALALFLVPSGRGRSQALLDWNTTRELPWGVLVLVGGGLSLGTAIEASGLAHHVAAGLTGLEAWPAATLVVAVAVVVILLSHVTSNTATAATMLPLMGSLALAIGQPPLLLAVPVALAASCAFMLPVATPPNAIVFGSGQLGIPDMVRAGSLISAAAVVVITLAVFLVAMPLFDGSSPG